MKDRQLLAKTIPAMVLAALILMVGCAVKKTIESPPPLRPAVQGRTFVLDEIKFFEASKAEVPDATKRKYSFEFDRDLSRYVYFELTVQNKLYGKQDNKVKIDAKYYYPDGNLMGEPVLEYTIPQSWDVALLHQGYGWDEPGQWPLGTYRVEFFTGGEKLGEKSFTVFETKKLGKGQKDAEKTWTSGKWGFEVTLPSEYDMDILDKPEGILIARFSDGQGTVRGIIAKEDSEGRADDYLNDVIAMLKEDSDIEVVKNPKGNKSATVVYISNINGTDYQYYARVIDIGGAKFRVVFYCRKNIYEEHNDIFEEYADTLEELE
ncbi:MAG: hypothetical protein HY811_10455 [Planctomycetes bacterium]|nr:hypothetical protein [Planctomycetota bacterium]